jgi:hypothetical protein
MDLNIKTKYPIKFELIEQAPFEIDNRFRKCKVYIAHEGLNLNNSVFSENTLKHMGKFLEGVAIVGYIDSNKFNEEDFRGHEMVLKREDGKYFYDYLCVPFGVVLKDNNAMIEELDLDGSGEPKKWLTCEGVLYNRFKKCIDIFERDGMEKSQSMELEETSIKGRFNNDKQFEFEEAKIEFLTILGTDVTPAMTGSNVRMFTSNEFKTSFSIMLDEINESLKTFNLNNTNSKKEDELMEENKIEEIVSEKPVEEFATVITTTSNESTTITETIDDNSYKAEEVRIEARTIEVTETQDTTPVDEVNTEEFTTEESVVESTEENFTEENVKEVAEPIEDPIAEKEFNVLESKEYKTLEEKFSALETKFNALLEEVESLRTFKANKVTEELKTNVDEITSKFALEESEVSELKAKAYNKEISLETYEEKLFAMVGKKNFSINKVEKVEEEKPISVNFSLKSTDDCPYPSLSQYFN